MSHRYKDDTFHMLETFAKTDRGVTGFGATSAGDSVLRGKSGNTWDAKHMTNFLNESNYSNWSEARGSQYSERSGKHRRYDSGDYFFKTTKDNKNASKIGYTGINPLVTVGKTSSHHKEVLRDHLSKQSPERYASPKHEMKADGPFRFTGNSVKFRLTDPLTLQHLEQRNPSEFEKTRLKWLIEKRHPHGMTGIDHPEDKEAKFYQTAQTENIRVRVEPNSGRSFVLDREWKSKGREDQEYKKTYAFSKGKITQQRKFNNDDAHGYNIVSNRLTYRLK